MVPDRKLLDRAAEPHGHRIVQSDRTERQRGRGAVVWDRHGQFAAIQRNGSIDNSCARYRPDRQRRIPAQCHRRPLRDVEGRHAGPPVAAWKRIAEPLVAQIRLDELHALLREGALVDYRFADVLSAGVLCVVVQRKRA